MSNEKVKLTAYSSKGGCGCKIGPGDLSGLLQTIKQGGHDPNLLVGLETNDDAGVYKLSDDLALVQTVDFFTPIVDDPYSFGQIAAANALSDVYAMGGKPLTALNIVAFPIAKLDRQVLAEILRGADDKVREAGAVLVGGHSIDDNEPKFGLAVTGVIHPAKLRTNAGAGAGDRLILTKPIGVGILTTALKQGQLDDQEIEQLTGVMTTLNRQAAEALDAFEVHACTDVTGFGLLGHAAEVAKGSKVGIVIHSKKVPVLPRVRALAEAGFVPGGTKNNHLFLADTVDYAADLDRIQQYILCDAVTSGGLLISVAAEQSAAVLDKLRRSGVEAVWIGETTADHPGKLIVTN